MSDAMDDLRRKLDAMASEGRRLRLWLRDDDAVRPTPALERLLTLCGDCAVPCLLAVIPRDATRALAERVRQMDLVRVAVHGWSHENHAPGTEKKQELGAHRSVDTVLDEVTAGKDRLRALFGAQALSILVPPWNRIAPEVANGLAGRGFQALSVFGPETPGPVAMLNTHVDLIDWRGSRGGRDDAALIADLLAALDSGVRDIGLLTHHLVHDARAWSFLDRFLALTAAHPACQWRPAERALAARTGSGRDQT